MANAVGSVLADSTLGRDIWKPNLDFADTGSLRPIPAHTYKVNLAAVPNATRTTVLAETQAAVRVLATKTGISFTYRGATSEVTRVGSFATQSADIIIAFTTPLKTNYLYGAADARGGNAASMRATTSGTTVTYTAAIVKGFVVVDTNRLLRAYKAGFGTGVRRGNLMMHELGYGVGLNHVSNVRLLMNPLLSTYSILPERVRRRRRRRLEHGRQPSRLHQRHVASLATPSRQAG